MGGLGSLLLFAAFFYFMMRFGCSMEIEMGTDKHRFLYPPAFCCINQNS